MPIMCNQAWPCVCYEYCRHVTYCFIHARTILVFHQCPSHLPPYAGTRAPTGRLTLPLTNGLLLRRRLITPLPDFAFLVNLRGHCDVVVVDASSAIAKRFPPVSS